MSNVLSLSAKKAKTFFLKEESYFNSDLPPYFQFGELLQSISKKIKDKKLSDFYDSGIKPKHSEDINYKLITNKDGKYAWRPLQLIHPAFYVSLVHEITKKNNWEYIVKKLGELIKNSKNIKCASLPVLSGRYKKDKAAQIIHWLGEVERQSICNSLKYEYLYETDIVDCYGSIYTHSIAWALHGKNSSKKDRGKDRALIGNIIDKQIEDMSYGQTNGIPQGSTLMDFIAEMVLCYTDSLLSEKLKNYTKKDYQIIRYRDDYRIFVNNPQTGEQIIKELAEIIHDFGMRINPQKTKITDHIAHDSIKKDKLYWMVNGIDTDNLQNKLYKISFLAQKFPNSGTVAKLLKIFYTETIKVKKEDIKTDITVLISILVDIAYKNPRTYSIVSAILSKFIDFLPKRKKEKVLKRILNKFNKIPNTGIMQLWLQRFTIKIDNSLRYSENLCKKVTDPSVQIWNSDWLENKFKKEINNCVLVNNEELEKLGAIITKEEVDLFNKVEYI